MSPLDALPQSGGLPDELLHSLAVEKLGAFFEDPLFCNTLSVRGPKASNIYSLDKVSKTLNNVRNLRRVFFIGSPQRCVGACLQAYVRF